MELNKQHRQSLVSGLSKAKRDLDTNEKCLKSCDESIKEHFEMSCFLSSKRIELIEQSLIDNVIDF